MPSTLQPSDGPSQPYSARSIALSVLVESVQSDEGIDVLLDRALTRTPLDSRDRALSVELTYGVLRRLRTIDWRLEPILDKPLPRLPVAVQMLLRLGAYQLLFLDRVPQSAAVNESVKLAKAQGRRLKRDRKSTRLNSSHVEISYAVFCLKKKKKKNNKIWTCAHNV